MLFFFFFLEFIEFSRIVVKTSMLCKLLCTEHTKNEFLYCNQEIKWGDLNSINHFKTGLPIVSDSIFQCYCFWFVLSYCWLHINDFHCLCTCFDSIQSYSFCFNLLLIHLYLLQSLEIVDSASIILMRLFMFDFSQSLFLHRFYPIRWFHNRFPIT